MNKSGGKPSNYKMRKYKHLFLVAVAQLVLSVSPLLAADIVIIKSNNIGPYNQAVAGFMQEIEANVSEYDLQGKSDSVPEIIEKIRKNPPRLIFALGALAAVKAKENISDIPVLYAMVLNPETKGLRGENITGISIEVDVGEQLSTFKTVVPGIKRVGVLYSHLTENLIFIARKTSKVLGLELITAKLSQPEDVPSSIKGLLAKVDALWLIPDSIVVNQDSLHYLLVLTLENDIPFLVYNKSFVKAGALLSPVVNYTSIGRQAAGLGQRVLQGKDLPAAILPPAGVEWAINLHIARSMGLRIPAEVLGLFKHVYE
jgi:putative ABC transport system substrate-binding protein